VVLEDLSQGVVALQEGSMGEDGLGSAIIEEEAGSGEGRGCQRWSLGVR